MPGSADRCRHCDVPFGVHATEAQVIAELRAALAISEAARVAAEERARVLGEALTKCPDCHGKGERDIGCRYCGDSTYDHECEERMRPCLTCKWVRDALAGNVPTKETTP